MRPAYSFAETASGFESKITLVRNDTRVDGKSVLEILTLGATQGTEIVVEATGSDATEAIQQLSDLVHAGFPSAKTESG